MTIRSLHTIHLSLCVAVAIGLAACAPAPEPETAVDAGSEPATEAEPATETEKQDTDDARGVPGGPIEIDPTGRTFGIRTVSGDSLRGTLEATAFPPANTVTGSGSAPEAKDEFRRLHVRGGRTGEVSFRVDGVDGDRLSDATVRSIEEAVERLRAQAIVPRDEDPRLLATRSTDEIWLLVRGEPHRPLGPPVATPGRRPIGGGTIILQDPEQGGEIAIPLESTDVRARIDGYVSSVDVRQRFHNPFARTIEVEYVFPLPHDAAVNDFVMVVGERRIRGIIRERAEAERIYENARRQGFKASLLTQERPNVFRQKVANIEANETIDVELHFFGKLPYVDGGFEFAFPLVVGPRYNPADAEDPIVPVSYAGPRPTGEPGVFTRFLEPGQSTRHRVSMTVDLDAGVAIERIASASHVVRIERDGDERATIRLAERDRLPNKDFVLRYEVAGDAVKSDAIVHTGDDGKYVSLMLVPPAQLANVERAPVEFVFVLDCSGSMNGWPMEQSKRAMRRALRQLRDDDTFQIIRFSERASALGAAPLPATRANVERGLDYVDRLRGSGGTQMIEGIVAALDVPSDHERLRVVTFMTDGYIGNENEIFAAIAERIGDTRIFSFGVGTSVNRHLLEGMARIGRGAVAYVGTGGDDTAVVDDFYRRVRHPALTDVTIDWGDLQVTSVYPQRIPDLFVGRPVLLHGAFAGDGPTTITVSGRAGGRAVRFEIAVDADDPTPRPALPLLWARTRIQELNDRLALDPGEHLKAEGLELALDFNLMSPWTSFVAVDGRGTVDDPATETHGVPTPLPDGVAHETTVGGNR